MRGPPCPAAAERDDSAVRTDVLGILGKAEVDGGCAFAAISSEIRAAIARGILFNLVSIAILALLPWLFAIR